MKGPGEDSSHGDLGGGGVRKTEKSRTPPRNQKVERRGLRRKRKYYLGLPQTLKSIYNVAWSHWCDIFSKL